MIWQTKQANIEHVLNKVNDFMSMSFIINVVIKSKKNFQRVKNFFQLQQDREKKKK